MIESLRLAARARNIELVVVTVLAVLGCGTRQPTPDSGKSGNTADAPVQASEAKPIAIHFWITPGLRSGVPREDSAWSDQSDGDSVFVVLTPGLASIAVVSADVVVRRFDTDSEIAERSGTLRTIHWVAHDTLDLAALPDERGGRRIQLLQPGKMSAVLRLAKNEFADRVTFRLRISDGRTITRTFALLASI
jgi:hypothetical protein